VLGLRVEPGLERQMGKTRSACIREAISHDLARHGDAAALE
jgi:predicted DNA-binding protein